MATITGMAAITQRGGKPILYLTRGDTAKVQALELEGTNVSLTAGRYVGRSHIGRREEVEKRGTVFVQEGLCKAGTSVTATVTFVFDGQRRLTLAVKGPYDRNRGILFYQQLPPQAATFRACTVDIDAVAGTDVEFGDSRLEYTERG